jgi:hypothetical protein
MRVKELKKILDGMNEEAIVYISNPNLYGSDYQTAHETCGIRYVVSANEEVWFETYADENIGDEVEAVADMIIENGMSDNDYVDELFAPDGHAYTMEDIRKNCEPSVYYWLRDNEYRKEMYPDV